MIPRVGEGSDRPPDQGSKRSHPGRPGDGRGASLAKIGRASRGSKVSCSLSLLIACRMMRLARPTATSQQSTRVPGRPPPGSPPDRRAGWGWGPVLASARALRHHGLWARRRVFRPGLQRRGRRRRRRDQDAGAFTWLGPTRPHGDRDRLRPRHPARGRVSRVPTRSPRSPVATTPISCDESPGRPSGWACGRAGSMTRAG